MLTEFSIKPNIHEATLDGAGQFCKPMAPLGFFNVSISGTFTGSVELQRSFNYVLFLKGNITEDKVTWMTCETVTAPKEYYGQVLSELEDDVHWRVGFPAGATVTGACFVRMSQ